MVVQGGTGFGIQRWKAGLFALSVPIMILGVLCDSSIAQRPVLRLPIFARDAKGVAHSLSGSELYHAGRWRELFARKDSPDDVFAIATDAVEGYGYLCPLGYPECLLEVLIYHNEGELRWFVKNDRHYYFGRKLGTDEVRAIRKFVAEISADDLPEYVNPTAVDGVVYHYFHVRQDRGCRVRMKYSSYDPVTAGDVKTSHDRSDAAWKYVKLLAFSIGSGQSGTLNCTSRSPIRFAESRCCTRTLSTRLRRFGRNTGSCVLALT